MTQRRFGYGLSSLGGSRRCGQPGRAINTGKLRGPVSPATTQLTTDNSVTGGWLTFSPGANSNAVPADRSVHDRNFSVRAGVEPAYLIGGALRTTGRNADWGEGEWLVVEADESDRSMLSLDVDVAVVTNVELDHHATYGSLVEVRDVFRAFLADAPEAVLWQRRDVIALRGDRPYVGFDVPEPVLTAGGSTFDWRGIEVRLGVPGAHNARNAAAALEACRLAGLAPEAAVEALAGFAGAGRRFETLGTTAAGGRVIDDYAHHPTEVAATIAAARTLGARRVVAVFQPHLYSRTKSLAREFGAALATADLPAVLDVYPARERAEDFPGVSGLLMAEATADAAGGRPVLWLPGFTDAEHVLRQRLREGDACLVMGAGNVDELGRRLVKQD